MAINRSRIENIRTKIEAADADACLISTNVNIYYCTGTVYTGYLYIPSDGEPLCMVKAGNADDARSFPIRKPEQIPAILAEAGCKLPEKLLLELGETAYSEVARLLSALKPKQIEDFTPALRRLRMYKSPDEIAQVKLSSERHIAAYREIPQTFVAGMRDIDFQCEIEYLMRKHGSLGIMRVFGSNMEIFMGSVLAGDNAQTVSPFDFALGGAGMHCSLPIGANGTRLTEGLSVMVDIGGGFTPYLSDISRTFSVGKLCDLAYTAHRVSMEMHEYLRSEVKPGARCADIYAYCKTKAEQAGLSAYFMGTKHQARFVGHGVGLQINEPPVLSPRSDDLVEENQVIAFEPKFVIPGVGAVGIESTCLVTATGVELLSKLDENIIDLLQ